MTTDRIVETRGKDPQLRPNNYSGVRSPNLLAKRPMIGLFMFLFGGLGFGALFYNLLAQGPLLQWDRTLATILPVIGLQNPATLKPIMNAGYYIGDWGIIGLAILFSIYFLVKRSWQELAMVVLGTVGTTILFESLSYLIGRARPPTQIWIILKIPGFPSGHTMAAVTFFGLLAYLLAPKVHSAFGKGFVVAVAILVMLFIGFTRIFTAAHYLTDVLAGYAMGIAWSGVVYTLVERYFINRKVKHAKIE
jgi:undecaprenyl-diphosphatase